MPEKWTQLMEEVLRDPWGKHYQYKSPAERSKKGYDLYLPRARRRGERGRYRQLEAGRRRRRTARLDVIDRLIP